MALNENQRILIRAIQTAECRIHNGLCKFEDIKNLKSNISELPFTLRRLRKSPIEDTVLAELQNRHYSDPNHESSSERRLEAFTKECYLLLSGIETEAFVMRWIFTKDVISAYVRNCYFRVKDHGVSTIQIQKLFPSQEVNLRTKISCLHNYTQMMKEQQPNAYECQLQRYPLSMLMMHGINKSDGASEFRTKVSMVLENFGCRAADEIPLDWSRIGMLLMVVANAVCDMIHLRLESDPEYTKEKVRIMLDVAAQHSECFIGNSENWQTLKSIAQNFQIPQIPNYTVNELTTADELLEEILPAEYGNDLFAHITSIRDQNFGGTCHIPKNVPTLQQLVYQAIPGNTSHEKSEYINKSMIYSGINPDEYTLPWNIWQDS